MVVDGVERNGVAVQHPMTIRVLLSSLQLGYGEGRTIVLNVRQKIEEASAAVLVKELVDPNHDSRVQRIDNELKESGRDIDFVAPVLHAFV
jgi:hypothetical protein